jgi:hypothetical protein
MEKDRFSIAVAQILQTVFDRLRLAQKSQASILVIAAEKATQT